MDFQSFLSAINQISEEKGLSSEKVIETVEHALASAYKKEYGKKGQIIKAKINPKTGKTEFSRVMLVVDDTMVYIPEKAEGEEKEKFKVSKSYRPTEEEINQEEPKEDVTDRRVRYNEERHLLIEEARKRGEKVEPGDEIVTILEPKEEFGRIAAQTAKQVVLQKIREAEKEIILKE